jgi:L-aminopeptidase/D-esterase-like protein
MTWRDAITDVPGIKAGHCTDLDAVTGCTVVLCERGAMGGVDVRGGAPATLGTDALKPGTLVEAVHAVLLAGGSAFGLDAASGVLRWCEERGIGISFGGSVIPIVAGAVIFDLGIGRSDVRPDADAGYRAAAAATGGAVAQGSVGAGTGATVAKAGGPERATKGGLGSASEVTDSGLIVGALFVVNAVGEVLQDGRVIAGPRMDDGSFGDSMTMLRERAQQQTPQNTTIGVVATNARLTKEQANRLAMVAHDGLARAVRPAHTLYDGDTIFALATGERELNAGDMGALEILAPRAVERAIIKAVREATSLGGVPAIRDWRA